MLGVEAGDLGSHSARKGAATFVACGTTVSPPIVSICLRAGWSLGKVKQKYLFYEKAGDQYLGRVACGLDVNKAQFAVTPPHFIGDKDLHSKVDSFLQSILLCPSQLPAKVKLIFRFCFAAICFHHLFCQDHYHPESSIMSSPVFTSVPSEIVQAAQVSN